ncbi:carbonic anhydrase [Blastopirellula retiformator]|uniref:Carbonic anhydrase n=1 Tax=Blastopirellula retiformator TaxID=2527970 RepID=A0A5C5V940_9BACT|nr:carbonic anhydrase [Blastopirellula retiformator]TWT34540.1 Carbonic anhydrase [Blastopirellula retiformator]
MTTGFAYNPNLKYLHSTPMERPADAAAAQTALERGNLAFRNWIASAYTAQETPDQLDPAQRRTKLETDFPTGQVPKQAPFAIVCGCSDARVPVSQLFSRSVNDLFEVRTAGQAMGDECLGSVEYSLSHMSSVKTVVVLGHSGCGAVTATVDSFLQTWGMNLGLSSVGLRSILQRIHPAVSLAAQSIQSSTMGIDFRRDADHKRLIDVATMLNAAGSAHQLRLLVNSLGRTDVSVLFGVYDIASHAVVRPPVGAIDGQKWTEGLAKAPDADDPIDTLAEVCVSASDPQQIV